MGSPAPETSGCWDGIGAPSAAMICLNWQQRSSKTSPSLSWWRQMRSMRSKKSSTTALGGGGANNGWLLAPDLSLPPGVGDRLPVRLGDGVPAGGGGPSGCCCRLPHGWRSAEVLSPGTATAAPGGCCIAATAAHGGCCRKPFVVRRSGFKCHPGHFCQQNLQRGRGGFSLLALLPMVNWHGAPTS